MKCVIGRALLPLLLACGTWSSANAEKNCTLNKPPKDSGVVTVHDQFFFVYPRSMDSKYSGCQTTWDERGVKDVVVKFSEGEPTEMWMAAEDPDDPASQPRICKYLRGTLSSDSPKGCPDYEAAKRGNLPDPNQPPVPKERDPRSDD